MMRTSSDLDAELLGLGDDGVADLAHQLAAPVRQHGGERHRAEHVAHRAVDDGAEPRAHALLVHRRLQEQQRIDDAVAREGVDDQAALVEHDHFGRVGVEIQQPLVEIDHVLHERHLGVQPRLLLDMHGLAELQHDRLLRLRHGVERCCRPAGSTTAATIARPVRMVRLISGLPAAAADRPAAAGRPVRLRSTTQLVERQERDDALSARQRLVDDDLVRAAQDLLHRFEIEPLLGDVLRQLVGVVDRRRSATPRLAPGPRPAGGSPPPPGSAAAIRRARAARCRCGRIRPRCARARGRPARAARRGTRR